MADDSRGGATASGRRARSTAAAALVGIGLMAAIDEIVFHQLLQWHHFYDRSTPTVGIFSDGLLHAGEVVAVVAGFFLLADLRRHRRLVPASAWAGLILGLGAFQLFDGIVDHKVLRIHQIRYDVDLLPYDLVWNVGGGLLLVIGTALALRAHRRSAGPR